MTDSPWHITATAVHRYLDLLGRPESEFAAAESELAAMARKVAQDVAIGAKQGREVRPGFVKYRGPRPLRLGLMVATETREPGDKPQLVDVLSSWEGGVGVGAGASARHGGSGAREKRDRRRMETTSADTRRFASTGPATVGKDLPMARSKAQLVELIPVTLQLTPAVLAEIRRLADVEGIVDSVWVYRAIEERMRRSHSIPTSSRNGRTT